MELQSQASLKRKWNEGNMWTSTTLFPAPVPSQPLIMEKPPAHQLDGGDLMSSKVGPSVTVVLEGRSICHRVNLHKHSSYRSLARALHRIFNVDHDHDDHDDDDDDGIDLSNAVPGYVVAYEDLESDLLLAGDLNWKDFVRVATRIRIVPVKSNSRKQRSINTSKSV